MAQSIGRHIFVSTVDRREIQGLIIERGTPPPRHRLTEHSPGGGNLRLPLPVLARPGLVSAMPAGVVVPAGTGLSMLALWKFDL
ncbi:hypothetical protein R3Q06_34770 [Rhodococcus erythropolis]|uniref:hypothetical protein n=1 Tax=Rhodococcus erythropolis TaxID=1833 RepID=UPI00294A678C|nr:hypothetical protein [Rhodococcus erythropolis]MDV6278562.1 hypothetical protein [Rhodococcus erythropolis]